MTKQLGRALFLGHEIVDKNNFINQITRNKYE